MSTEHNKESESANCVLVTKAAGESPVVSLTVAKVKFNDGTELKFAPNDIVVIVGPNNSGKSEALRGIRDKIAAAAAPNPVVSSVEVQRKGSSEDLLAWLDTWAIKTKVAPDTFSYRSLGRDVQSARIRKHWENESHSVGDLARWFCHMLTTEDRLGVGNAPAAIALSHEPPQHPIHFMRRDRAVETLLSDRFRSAFGVDLIVHRDAGNTIPLHVGQRPALEKEEERSDLSYIEKVEALPTLQTQGDGMRSYAGVLLATSVAKETIMLIDEPEAFLHPPQARLLGKAMVDQRLPSRQLFIATHSTDILRGILNADSQQVTVARFRRSDTTNGIKVLNNERVKELWSDPLLRYSNILDGLFHEAVVVCEGDSDCRFYSAVLDTIVEAAHQRSPDVMFTHCGGKGRLPLVIRALRGVDVPVVAVSDFDVLSAEEPLRSIVQALGMSWDEVQPDWLKVKRAIDSKKPELSTTQVRKDVTQILEPIKEPALPEAARREIQSVLKRSSAWTYAKEIGAAFVPAGEASSACTRLLGALKRGGLHVVPVGELESFVRTVGGEGPAWVNAVLSANVLGDASLAQAREFVGGFMPMAAK
jgi:predicted ATPase